MANAGVLRDLTQGSQSADKNAFLLLLYCPAQLANFTEQDYQLGGLGAHPNVVNQIGASR